MKNIVVKVKAKIQVMQNKLQNCSGQGTAEYAILVGVLVIAAIGIIVAVGGKVTDLWQGIQDGLSTVSSK